MEIINNAPKKTEKAAAHQSKHLSILVWIGQQLAAGVFVWETFQLWYMHTHRSVCVCVFCACTNQLCPDRCEFRINI